MNIIIAFVFGAALALGAVLPIPALWAIIWALTWVLVALTGLLVALTGALVAQRPLQVSWVRRGGFVAVGVRL